MGAYHYDELPLEQVREGLERRVAYTDNLMIVLIDIHDGPKSEPDPPHSHPHEQVSYVAEGELYFFLEGEPTRLQKGDVFVVPSGQAHTIQPLTRHVRLIDCFTPIRADFLKQ